MSNPESAADNEGRGHCLYSFYPAYSSLDVRPGRRIVLARLELLRPRRSTHRITCYATRTTGRSVSYTVPREGLRSSVYYLCHCGRLYRKVVGELLFSTEIVDG